MEYIFSSVFGRTAEKYGLVAGILVLAIFASIAVLAYYAKAKIDLMRGETLQAQQERMQELQSRDRERLAMIGELNTARQGVKEMQEKLYTLMTNHLEHDRDERSSLVQHLTEISARDAEQVQTMRVIADDIKLHREEENMRAGKMYEKMNLLEVKFEAVRRIA